MKDQKINFVAWPCEAPDVWGPRASAPTSVWYWDDYIEKIEKIKINKIKNVLGKAEVR